MKKLVKIEENLFYLKSKIERSEEMYNINGVYYSVYSSITGSIDDAIKKAKERTKLGYNAIIMYNGESRILVDGRSPKKGFKKSYTVLS